MEAVATVNPPTALQRLEDLDASLRKTARRAALDYGIEPSDALDHMISFLVERAADPACTLFENRPAYILRAAFLDLRHALWSERRSRKYALVSLDDALDCAADEDDGDWDDALDGRERARAVRQLLDRLEPALRDVARAIMDFDEELEKGGHYGGVNVARLSRRMGVTPRTLGYRVNALRCALKAFDPARRPEPARPSPLDEIARIVEERCARLQAELEDVVGDRARLTISFQLS